MKKLLRKIKLKKLKKKKSGSKWKSYIFMIARQRKHMKRSIIKRRSYENVLFDLGLCAELIQFELARLNLVDDPFRQKHTDRRQKHTEKMTEVIGRILATRDQISCLEDINVRKPINLSNAFKVAKETKEAINKNGSVADLENTINLKLAKI